MKKKMITLLMAGLMTVLAASPVFAAEYEQDSAGNFAISGDHVSLPDTALFGAFAAGQDIDLSSAEAEGSVMAAGQQITGTNMSVGESLYAAGNTLTFNDIEVDGNIFMAGNNVNVTGNSEGKGVYMVGNYLCFEGKADAVYLAGNSVYFEGTIDGDVTIEAESVEIGDNTSVSGELKIVSPKEPAIGEGVEAGEYTYDQPSENIEGAAVAVGFGARILKKLTKCLYWIVAMATVGMLLCWLFDGHLTRASEFIKNRTAAMVVSGIAGWAGIPIVVIFLFCSYILAPAGGLLLLAYILLLCIGLAFAGASLSRLVFPRMNRFLAALIGIAALELLRIVPVLGFIIGMAADMYLIGYVIQSLWIGRLKKEQ